MVTLYVDGEAVDFNHSDEYFLVSDAEVNRRVKPFLGGSLGAGAQPAGAVRRWIGVGTTTSGIVTLYPTSDDTDSGDALFDTIWSVQVTATSPTSTPESVPLASLRSIAVDRKTITAIVVQGVGLGVGVLATMELAPNGTEVRVVIDGLATVEEEEEEEG